MAPAVHAEPRDDAPARRTVSASLDAGRIAGLLADPARLRVVAALALGATTVDDVRERTGLGARDLAEALARLDSAGLVVQQGATVVLVEAAFADAARRAAPAPEVVADAGERVLATFVRDGRLVSVPTQRAKRLVVLDRIAQDFEPGLRYDEADVNAIVARWHDDYVALRRHLVDEEFLSRAEGTYWRSGGSVDAPST